MSGFYGAPRLPSELIARPALMELLDQPYALTIVRGMLGMGKTTAIAQWARERDHRGVWIVIDEGATTRLAFWKRALTLMDDAGVATRGRDVSFEAGAVGLGPDLLGLLTRIAMSLAEPVVLVIDRYELIRDAEVHRDVATMLQHSDQLRIVIATRTVGPLEDAKLGLEVDRLIIDPCQLAFTRDETAAVLRAAGAKVDQAAAAAVLEAAEGIPLAVRAAGITIAQGGDDVPRLIAGEDLLDRLKHYFTGTVLEVYQAEPYLHFLLRVSVADKVPLAFAAELATVPATVAEQYLARAEAEGLGMWTDSVNSGAPPQFSLSALVRVALNDALRQRFPDQVDALRRQYAQWCYRNADPFTALAEALRAGELVLASRVLGRGFFVVAGVHGEELTGLLTSIPQARLSKYPVLVMFLAVQYNSGEATRNRAAALFAIAASVARKLSVTGDAIDRILMSSVQTVASRIIGRTSSALEATERTIQLYGSLSGAARAELAGALPSVLTIAALTYWHSGQFSRAIDLYKEAYVLGENSPVDTLMTVPLLAASYATLGDMVRSSTVMEQARALDGPDWQVNDFFVVPYHLAEAVAALEVFDLDLAQRHIDVVEPTFRTYEYWPLFVPLQAFIDAARGRPHASLVRLRAARAAGARPATLPQMQGLHYVVEALLHLSAGEVVAAERLIKTRSAQQPSVAIVKALGVLLTGDADQAIARTYSLNSSEGLDARTESILLMIRAAAALRLGQYDLALRSLDQAAMIMQTNGLRTPLAFIPQSDLASLTTLVRTAGAGGMLELLDSVGSTVIPGLFPTSALRIVLTPRERRLLQHLSATKSTMPQIAAALNVSPSTLKNQRTSLYRKLGVRTREEAVQFGYQRELLEE